MRCFLRTLQKLHGVQLGSVKKPNTGHKSEHGGAIELRYFVAGSSERHPLPLFLSHSCQMNPPYPLPDDFSVVVIRRKNRYSAMTVAD